MYQPKEDSYFLSEQLSSYLKNKNKQIRILDMGSGSGIQAETCLNLGFRNILAVDINPEVIKLLKMKFKTQRSDLFEKIKEKFDLIIFNPPYLPENEYDKEKDTTGGKKGDETIIRFLNQSRNHLNKDGRVLLLLSSYTPQTRIYKILRKYYNIEKKAEKKIFFESLFILLLSLNKP